MFVVRGPIYKFVEKMNDHIDRLCEFYKVSRKVLLNHFAEEFELKPLKSNKYDIIFKHNP